MIVIYILNLTLFRIHSERSYLQEGLTPLDESNKGLGWDASINSDISDLLVSKGALTAAQLAAAASKPK